MKRLTTSLVLIMMALLVNAQLTVVNVSALPEPLPKFLNTHYPGFITEKACKVIDKNNQVTYETVITKGTIKETLIFDKDGNFLRKYTGSLPATGKSRANTARQGPNRKINATTKQAAPDIKRVGSEKPEEEKPVQKRDTIRKQ